MVNIFSALLHLDDDGGGDWLPLGHVRGVAVVVHLGRPVAGLDPVIEHQPRLARVPERLENIWTVKKYFSMSIN